MCVVSMIGDQYRDSFPQRWPDFVPYVPYDDTYSQELDALEKEIKKDELDALRKEVKELKEELRKAKEYDARTGQLDCEMGNKIDFMRSVGKLVGVDLDDVFKNFGPSSDNDEQVSDYRKIIDTVINLYFDMLKYGYHLISVEVNPNFSPGTPEVVLPFRGNLDVGVDVRRNALIPYGEVRVLEKLEIPYGEIGL